MARKRIGILTGGGDVPGLNAVIKTVTYRSSENDIGADRNERRCQSSGSIWGYQTGRHGLRALS
jgi:6-phosphofructokinase